MADKDLKSTENFQYASMGQNGCVVLTSASATTASGVLFGAIQVLSAASITAVDNTPGTRGEDLSALSVPAGQIVVGRWSEINLGSGTVIAYYL